MKVKIISRQLVEQLLPMDKCIDLMEQAFKELGNGEAVQPLRHALWMPDKAGLLGMMPALNAHKKEMGIKVVSVFPDNHTRGLPSHIGVTLLFDGKDGQLLSIQDAESSTAIRTAAASAVATKYLAREDASRMTIMGAGVQGEKHIEAISRVRELDEVVVWSRTADNASRLAETASSQYSFAVRFDASAERAVEGADIICTTSSAREPVLESDWVRAGVHINAVGSCTPHAREIDGELMARVKLYTDSKDSLYNESGDYLLALNEGLITDSQLKGVMSDLLLDNVTGRETDEEITLFESLGIGVEDLTVASYLLDIGTSQNVGVDTDI